MNTIRLQCADLLPGGTLLCMEAKGHSGPHASRYGDGRIVTEWNRDLDRPANFAARNASDDERALIVLEDLGALNRFTGTQAATQIVAALIAYVRAETVDACLQAVENVPYQGINDLRCAILSVSAATSIPAPEASMNESSQRRI